MVQCTTRDGSVTIISLFEKAVEFDPNPLVHGERTIGGVFAYESGLLGHRDYETIIRLIEDGWMNPEPLITGRIGLEIFVEGSSNSSRTGRADMQRFSPNQGAVGESGDELRSDGD